jgi:hypothetical protein
MGASAVRTMSVMKRLASVFSLSLIISACAGDATKDPGAPAGTAAGSTAADHPTPSADGTPTIRTAQQPDDPCAWSPAADVEAIMGKLAEPPRKEDGCLYTFVLPEAVAAKRQQAKELQQKIAERFGKPDPAFTRPGSIFAAQDDPRSYAVSVSVDVEGEVEAEPALDSVAKMFGVVGNAAEQPAGEAAKTAMDWDDVRSIPYGFMGRTGHVRISVQAKAPDVPGEQMRALAEKVRDRVPDLPFAVTNPYQVIQLGTLGDPCSLLTKAEAEAVLGPLSAEPYRSSSNWPPLAHSKGFACAYFTPGHHVFVLSPTWSGGADSFKIEKGIGGLVGIVAPQEEMVVMKGPWDAAQMGISGALMFLKGEKLLEVHYRTSRATRGDAIKLAAIAMRRLAP